MLTKELIDNNLPQLQLNDTVGKALSLIQNFHLLHLPIVLKDKFIGLISEDDLLDADEDSALETLQYKFISAFVPSNVHFLNAVNVSIEFDISVVPVINNQHEYEGSITITNLLKKLGNFSGAGEIGGLVVLEMKRSQFAISEISKIVESNNCTILHLNTTIDNLTGMLTVTIHINKREIDSIIATFERYDYHVIYSFGNEKSTEEIDNNFKNLMNYLSI
jgi:acetoin utilization protein AcuB